MEHFVRVILDEKREIDFLNESVFPEQSLLETTDGRPVFEFPLTRELNEDEANEYAEKLAAYMFSEGYDNFDIEVSQGNTK
tara:strand:+ start:437 stop:679 length:243 start_codon:yes stop_codon:yes gene_type:complete